MWPADVAGWVVEGVGLLGAALTAPTTGWPASAVVGPAEADWSVGGVASRLAGAMVGGTAPASTSLARLAA
jgi:hypothetical protein